MTNKKKVQEMVYEILRDVEAARNFDYIAYSELLLRFYKQYIVKNKDGAYFIPMSNLQYLPSYSTVDRCRRKIQETEFKATDPEVRKKRKQNTDDWLEALGYTNTPTLF